MLKSEMYLQKSSFKMAWSVFSFILLAITGFLSSNTLIASSLSPLNVAIVAAIQLPWSIVVLATSITSYIVTSTFLKAIINIITMIAVIALKYTICELFGKKSTAAFNSILTGIIMTTTSISISIIEKATIEIMAIRFAQSILCSCTVYFLITAIKVIKSEKMLPVSGSAGASIGIIYIIVLATFSSIHIYFVNFGRVLGLLIMLLAIKKYKHIGGAITGILTSSGIILCSLKLGSSTILLACAGLVAGIFSEAGTLPTLLAFILTNVIGLIMIGADASALTLLIDLGIASAIYIIVPSSIWSKLLLNIGYSDNSVEVMAQNASRRLDFASRTLKDVQDSIEKISSVMENRIKNKDLITKVSESVCSNCKNNLICWEQNFNNTNNAFYTIEAILNARGKIDIQEFPEEISYCAKASLLQSQFNALFNDMNYQQKLQQNLKDMRVISSDSFQAMQEMLDDMSKQLSRYNSSDNYLSKKVNNYFEKLGISNPVICAYYNKNLSLCIEIYLNEKLLIKPEQLCNDLSDIVEKELEYPRIAVVNGVSKIELWEKTHYYVDTGGYALAGHCNEATGDSYEIFEDNESKAYVILSDGMGSGKKAQLDSLITSNMISRLLKAGIGYNSAIRLINTSMRVKSWEESFATVDISVIDLCTGSLKIIKAGGCASYVLRGSNMTKLSTSSLPIGILAEMRPAIIYHALRANDILIQTSDGVAEEAYIDIQQTCITNKNSDAKHLAREIVKCAKKYSDKTHNDDITVVVSKVLLNK